MLCLLEINFGYLCGKKVAEENIFMTLIFLVSNIFIAAIVYFSYCDYCDYSVFLWPCNMMEYVYDTHILR